ncbi:MAG: 3-isopropylmalate dehydratase large subunit [Anaerolineae bacterium]|nr:3-isopropylmalate dehydratase large subunit [Anaerolineae bacterium]
MSRKTFAEKALARAAGLAEVVAGQIVDARPDLAFSHDNTAPIARTFYSLGVKRVKYPERLAFTMDHAVPAPTTAHAQNHADTRRFAQEQGVTNVFEVGRGICHQVLSEEALALPGYTVLGSDSHTPHFGWLGAFGAGIGRSEMAAVWATGELWLRVPESVRVVLTGEWPEGVTSKDFCLRLISDQGGDAGIYLSIEFSGPAVHALSIDSRAVIPNMMAEFGVKSAYIAPDDLTFDYLAPRRARRAGQPVEAVREAIVAGALYPDPDADYLAEYHYDVSQLEPMVSLPHRVDRAAPVSQVRGTRIQQAFVGTCTNGRLEDLKAAAQVVRGRRVASGARLLVIPASSEVYMGALRAGYIETLMEAGAVIGTPGCGPCMGNHMGVPATGEVTISSANRNFQGRMGTRDAEIYLANPAVVAASAVAGYIIDPRELTT